MWNNIHPYNTHVGTAERTACLTRRQLCILLMTHGVTDSYLQDPVLCKPNAFKHNSLAPNTSQQPHTQLGSSTYSQASWQMIQTIKVGFKIFSNVYRKVNHEWLKTSLRWVPLNFSTLVLGGAIKTHCHANRAVRFPTAVKIWTFSSRWCDIWHVVNWVTK